MPTISRFNKYKITLNYNDHLPPHIHVQYEDKYATIDINEIKKIEGEIKEKDLKVIYRWMRLRKSEIINNWNLARKGEPLVPIMPYNKNEKGKR